MQRRQLLEHERIVGALVGRLLEREARLLAVAELLAVEPAHPIQRERSLRRIDGEVGLAPQHPDQVAPAVLRVAEPLERVQRARHLRVEPQRRLVELDRGVDALIAVLEQPRPLDDERGAVARVLRDRVGLHLERALEARPVLAREVALLECLEDGGVSAVQLGGGRVRLAGLVRGVQVVLEHAALGEEQRRLAPRVRRHAGLGVEERQRLAVAAHRQRGAARPAGWAGGRRGARERRDTAFAPRRRRAAGPRRAERARSSSALDEPGRRTRRAVSSTPRRGPARARSGSSDHPRARRRGSAPRCPARRG